MTNRMEGLSPGTPIREAENGIKKDGRSKSERGVARSGLGKRPGRERRGAAGRLVQAQLGFSEVSKHLTQPGLEPPQETGSSQAGPVEQNTPKRAKDCLWPPLFIILDLCLPSPNPRSHNRTVAPVSASTQGYVSQGSCV